MAKIELPQTTDQEDDLPRTKTTLLNMWVNDKGQGIARPGINPKSQTLGPARGAFEWQGSIYNVSGTTLIRIIDPETGTFVSVGTIAGSANIEWDVGQTQAVIVVRGGAIYTLSDAGVLSGDISGNPNFRPCVDVAFNDQRFLYVPADGSEVFFSDVGDAATVQADSFFDAESLPDKNSGIINFKNRVYILGANSIEPYNNVGTTPVPYLRVQGGRIDFGFISALLEYQETFLFIGRAKGQTPGIFAIAPGRAQRISNTRIDKLLSTYTEDELREAIPGRFEWDGYDIFTITLRRDSLAFFGTKIFLLDTIFNGISRPWGGGFITAFDNKYYTAFSNQFGRFEKVNTDYGNPITRAIEFGFPHPDQDRFGMSGLQLGISQGYNQAEGSVALRMSRDNVIYGPPVYRRTADIGKYGDRLVWRPPGGLGNYEGFAGFQIATTENIGFNIDFIDVDL